MKILREYNFSKWTTLLSLACHSWQQIPVAVAPAPAKPSQHGQLDCGKPLLGFSVVSVHSLLTVRTRNYSLSIGGLVQIGDC